MTRSRLKHPERRFLVTFQWEELNNLIPQVGEGPHARQINWDQVEMFEPRLECLGHLILSIRCLQERCKTFGGLLHPAVGPDIQTIGSAEGGFASAPVGRFPAPPQDQVDYLNASILRSAATAGLWIYLLINDFNLDSVCQNHEWARQKRRCKHTSACSLRLA